MRLDVGTGGACLQQMKYFSYLGFPTLATAGPRTNMVARVSKPINHFRGNCTAGTTWGACRATMPWTRDYLILQLTLSLSLFHSKHPHSYVTVYYYLIVYESLSHMIFFTLSYINCSAIKS